MAGLCFAALIIPSMPSSKITARVAMQTFPVELLAEIFMFANAKVPECRRVSDEAEADIIALSSVCRRWRAAAVGYTGFWESLRIRHEDGHRKYASDVPGRWGEEEWVIESVLRRSGEQELKLVLDFSALDNVRNGATLNLVRLLVMLRPHLGRVWHLGVRAQAPVWQVITAMFKGEEYAVLEELDLVLVDSPKPWEKMSWLARQPRARANTFADATNAIAAPEEEEEGAGDIPALHNAPHSSPSIVFEIPANHPSLHNIALTGVTVSRVPLGPSVLIRVRAEGRPLPDLVSPDSQISRWLLDTPWILCIEDLLVPPMPDYSPEQLSQRPISHVQYMNLARLRATPDPLNPDEELSCRNFFDALYTPLVRILLIDRWMPTSRVWRDFFEWLPFDIRFPEVQNLILMEMHLDGAPYSEVVWFLSSFPKLQYLQLSDCLWGTWELVMETLEMDSDVAPLLDRIHLSDEEFVMRDDPLPFAGDRYGFEVDPFE